MMRYLVLFALPFVADVYGKGKINNGYYLLCGEDHCRLVQLASNPIVKMFSNELCQI
jgi:hypothetical protein